MPVEQFITESIAPVTIVLQEFLAPFAISVNQLTGLFGLLIFAIAFVKWGTKAVRKGIVDKIFANKWISKHSGITVKDFDEPEGWKELLTYIPRIIKYFLLFFFLVAGLNILGITVAAEAIEDIRSWIPGLIIFIGTLVLGYIITTKAELKFITEKSAIIKYGFYAAVWFVMLSIGLTQLQIGTEIIPILVGGIMATITVSAFGLKWLLANYIHIEALKNLGLEPKQKIEIRGYDGKSTEYEIIKLGITHIKVKKDGKLTFIENSLWTERFSILDE